MNGILSPADRLAETTRFPDHVICALTLERAAGIRWSIIGTDPAGAGVMYVRSARDDLGGAHLLAQYNALKAYCDWRGLHARAVIAALGSGIAETRPDLERLVQLASEDWCEWIAALACERFTRSHLDYIDLQQRLARSGTRLEMPCGDRV